MPEILELLGYVVIFGIGFLSGMAWLSKQIKPDLDESIRILNEMLERNK